MKINSVIIILLLLKSVLTFSQIDNLDDTLCIKLNGHIEINAKRYEKLVISKDSSAVCGFIRSENNNIYYFNKGKEIRIWGEHIKRKIKLEDFGFFGTVELRKKNSYLSAKTISILHSQSYRLHKITV